MLGSLSVLSCRGNNPLFMNRGDATTGDAPSSAPGDATGAAAIDAATPFDGAKPIADATAPADTASGTTFWLSATEGDDKRSCEQAKTMGTPLRTIQRGIQCIGSGDSLVLRGGTYDSDGIASSATPLPLATSWETATRIMGLAGEKVIFRPAPTGCACGFNLGGFPAQDQYLVISDMVLDG